MQLKRVTVTVKFKHRTEQKSWLSNYISWLRNGGFEWINHIGLTNKPKAVKDPEIARQDFLRLAHEMKTHLYSNDTIKSFTKSKLPLPVNFVVDNIMRLGVARNEPEEICIAGSGDTSALISWLDKYNYEYIVRDTY